MKETFKRTMVTTAAVTGLGLSSNAFAQKAPLLERMTELAYEYNLQKYSDLVPLGVVAACCGVATLAAFYCMHQIKRDKKKDDPKGEIPPRGFINS